MRAWLPIAAIATLAGCARQGVLVAETGEHRLTARDDVSKVMAVVTTEVWDGKPEDLDEAFTVLHVLVANNGEQPILLAPGDFELRDTRGFRYALADPGGTFHAVGDGASHATEYGREVRRDYDPGGPVEFVPVFGEGDMAARALPWGVLLPQTQMRGYLFFEPFTRTSNGSRLVWHVQTPEHTPVVDLRFDLFVSRGG